MRHEPVLLEEVIRSLALFKGARVIDCTLGDGGHSERMLQKIGETGTLLGLDADADAIVRATTFLSAYADRVRLVHSNFMHLSLVANTEGYTNVDAILFDLGWSTPQFEDRGRGFSFQKDEPLDMRYGSTSGHMIHGLTDPTAAELLRILPQEELEKVLRVYGEEPQAVRIAAELVRARREGSLRTSRELAECVLRVYRSVLKTDKEIPWIGGVHPATKTFQAIRILVNDELSLLPRALTDATDLLRIGGRVGVITFHSGEDRIIKHAAKRESRLIPVAKKPIIPSEIEAAQNPRARSAKLRVYERQS